MADATPAVSPLRCRMIDDMMLRNLSPATQRSYLHAVAKFGRYFGRSPDRLGLEDVPAFQVYPTQSDHFCGMDERHHGRRIEMGSLFSKEGCLACVSQRQTGSQTDIWSGGRERRRETFL